MLHICNEHFLDYEPDSFVCNFTLCIHTYIFWLEYDQRFAADAALLQNEVKVLISWTVIIEIPWEPDLHTP